MEKDELTAARIEDKILQCREQYYITNTGLLDSHEQAIAKRVTRSTSGVRSVFYGGYDEAERRMLVCIPTDFTISDEEAVEGLLCVLRVTKPHISRDLSHRDYLGSMLGLGIDRRLTGDILVRENGADIFILPEIAEFLKREYHHVGRTDVKTEVVSVKDVIIPESQYEIIRDTVSSARLDSIVSSAFRISRSKAAEAVRSGLISVDHSECLKTDAKVEEGAVLVMRGKGKAVLEEIGSESKKKRTWIRIRRYI